MRISRPCYNKFHRCPGWAGGGTHSAKVTRCEGGYLAGCYQKAGWKWRLNRCGTCRIIVLPYMTRWLDAGWWKWKLLFDLVPVFAHWEWEHEFKTCPTGDRHCQHYHWKWGKA